MRPPGITCWYRESKNTWSEITLTPLMRGSLRISAVFHTPISPLSRIFKRNRGITPNQFLTGIRLDRAKTLMNEEPEMPIRDIALSVGYEDPLYFSRLFKKKLGLYPTEFRGLGTSR